MQTWLMATCLMALIAISGTTPAHAWGQPWCSSGGMSDTGSPAAGCGFASFEQCRAVSNRCTPNPFYEQPKSGKAARRR